jgi:hypothetical protein
MVRRKFRNAVGSVLAGVSLAATTSSAWAYCRTTTCNDAACGRDLEGCIVGGKPLSWQGSCVSFSVHEHGAPRMGVSSELASTLISRAFERWLQADCGSGPPSIAIAATELPARCDRPEQNRDGANANVWMFRNDSWPYARSALAVTVVSYSTSSGVILGADVEMNAVAADLTLGDEQVGFDLESIIQHEAGHFLGLSHSGVREATMWRTIGSGITDKRALHADDLSAVCEAYPPSRPQGTCDFTPRGGWSADCAPVAQESSCRASRGSPAAPGPPGALLALCAAFALRRVTVRVRRRSSA